MNSAYSVVHFLVVNSVEVVPSIWVKKMAHVHGKINTTPYKYIEKQCILNDDTFIYFKVMKTNSTIHIF